MTPTPYGPEGYIAAGVNANGVGTSTLFINPAGSGDNTSGTFRNSLRIAGFGVGYDKTPAIVSTSNTSHEVFDIADQNNGDFRLVSYNNFNQTRWIKTLGGSGFDDARSIIATDDGGYLVAGVTTSTDGDIRGKPQNNLATWIVKLSGATTANALTLTQPTYNCQTGAITFNTTGGSGSPITFTAPGITRANATDNFGTVEAGLRGDPKPITITATQSGYTTRYAFDLRAYCNNLPTSGTLQLLAPTILCGDYDVLLTINTTGDNGSPIAYAVPGATLSSPASNTASVYKCINDNNPFQTIQATQSEYTATFTVNLMTACPRTQFGQPLITRQIPDLTLSVGQTLQSFEVTSYFSDPNRLPRYPFLAQYTFSATGMPAGITYSTVGTRNNSLIAKFLGTPSGKPGIYRVTITAGTIFCDPVTSSFNIILTDLSAGSTLSLTQPTYNCQTGAITFNTTGGNGSPITYTAPGISRASVTDNFGTIEAGLRGDPKPITITATQSGQSVSYSFDFGAFCSGNQPPQPPVTPPTTGALTLLAPTYDCTSGAFTFKSSGGDNSPIEYQAAGITGWTTNPNQFVDKDSRTANDVKPFTLMARQSGQTVIYTWDLKAACGRANSRLQAAQADNPLTLTVLGNPVHEQLRVRVQGSNGQPVLLQLTDLTGRSIESRTLFQADVEQEQVFELRQQGAGLLLLRASNGTQQRTVKVVKQ